MVSLRWFLYCNVLRKYYTQVKNYCEAKTESHIWSSENMNPFLMTILQCSIDFAFSSLIFLLKSRRIWYDSLSRLDYIALVIYQFSWSFKVRICFKTKSCHWDMLLQLGDLFLFPDCVSNMVNKQLFHFYKLKLLVHSIFFFFFWYFILSIIDM